MFSPNADNPCTGGMGCALLPWCLSARRLRDALSRSGPPGARVDLLAIVGGRRKASTAAGAAAAEAIPQPPFSTCLMSNLTEQLDPSDCPGLRQVVAGAPLQLAVARHVERVVASGVMSYNPRYMRRMGQVLYKWELLRLSEYDAILFADLDVDLLPANAHPDRVGREWAARLPQLLEQARGGDQHTTLAADGASSGAVPGGTRPPVHVVGYGDLTSPWVAGLFWVFPPRDHGALYRQGVRVLNAPWDATKGWNRTGTPAELWGGGGGGGSGTKGGGGGKGGGGAGGNAPQRHADGSLTGHSLLHRPLFRKGWENIDGGDLEQGHFLYMLWYLHGSPDGARGAFLRRDAAHQAAHYVRSPRKPWRRSLAYKPELGCGYEPLHRQYYLHSLGPMRGHRSACAAAFKRARRELTFDRAACCEQFGEAAPKEPLPHGAGGYDRLHVF